MGTSVCYVTWSRPLQVVQEVVKHKNVSTKSTPIYLVTEADQQVEELVISTLRDKFPSHRFIGEESSAAGEKCILTDRPSWNIDGTCNFVHGFSMVAVSVGFAVKKEFEFGLIYHCFNGMLYTARKGQRGILHWCKDQRFKGKRVKRDPATLNIFSGNIMKLLSAPAHGVRIIGTSTLALCLIATEAAEAYYQYGLHCWDIREAGGVVRDTTGLGCCTKGPLLRDGGTGREVGIMWSAAVQSLAVQKLSYQLLP
ncbi:inositol monophosphatase 2-like [Salvelinus alpinus]